MRSLWDDSGWSTMSRTVLNSGFSRAGIFRNAISFLLSSSSRASSTAPFELQRARIVRADPLQGASRVATGLIQLNRCGYPEMVGIDVTAALPSPLSPSSLSLSLFLSFSLVLFPSMRKDSEY